MLKYINYYKNHIYDYMKSICRIIKFCKNNIGYKIKICKNTLDAQLY